MILINKIQGLKIQFLQYYDLFILFFIIFIVH